MLEAEVTGAWYSGCEAGAGYLNWPTGSIEVLCPGLTLSQSSILWRSGKRMGSAISRIADFIISCDGRRSISSPWYLGCDNMYSHYQWSIFDIRLTRSRLLSNK